MKEIGRLAFWRVSTPPIYYVLIWKEPRAAFDGGFFRCLTYLNNAMAFTTSVRAMIASDHFSYVVIIATPLAGKTDVANRRSKYSIPPPPLQGGVFFRKNTRLTFHGQAGIIQTTRAVDILVGVGSPKYCVSFERSRLPRLTAAFSLPSYLTSVARWRWQST